MQLPKTINPCPILDALLEIRFSSKIHPNAVFGLIYNILKSDFENVENLPILQLPEAVRISDPNFLFKPHYRFSNERLVIQIGPDVLTVSSFPKYIGWKDLSNNIFEILEKLEKTGIIDSTLRIGIRYINFFELDIFEQINLDVLIRKSEIPYNNTVIRTEIVHDNFNSTLQIANNANNQGRIGSIIDIDTFTNYKLDKFFANKAEIINNGHIEEKKLFFSLLKDDFLKTLNPEY